MNLETIIDPLSWYKIWQLNGFNLVRAKPKFLRKTEKNLHKFLESKWKPKVIYNDNSQDFGKVCEDLSWNHCTSTPHRSETDRIAGSVGRRINSKTGQIMRLNKSCQVISVCKRSKNHNHNNMHQSQSPVHSHQVRVTKSQCKSARHRAVQELPMTRTK